VFFPKIAFGALLFAPFDCRQRELLRPYSQA